MYIQKYENHPLELKETNYEAFYDRLGFMQNVLEDCKYTGIYVEEGDKKQYIFYCKGIFYKIPMTEQEFKALEEKYKRRSQVQNPNKNIIVGFYKISNELNRKELTIIDIMFLYSKLGDLIEVEPTIRVIGNEKCITKKDILQLVKNITILEKEINNRNLRNNSFELVKFIYDYYKMSTYYWIGDNYKYGEGIIDLNTVDSTANHPYSYLGLINEHYATCQGMSQGLAQLYNFFGIKADTARNSLHSVTRLHLSDNCVTYLDLAKEISPNWKDSLYDGWTRRTTPIKCTNPNSYNWFCKSRIGLGQVDNQQYNSIDLCDNFGNLTTQLTTIAGFQTISRNDNAQTTNTGFRTISRNDNSQTPIAGFRPKR